MRLKHDVLFCQNIHIRMWGKRLDRKCDPHMTVYVLSNMANFATVM